MTDTFGAQPSAIDRSSLLEALQETSNDAIITIDARGLIQTFNTRAEFLFGYERGEVIGKNVKLLMPGHFREQHDWCHRHQSHDQESAKSADSSGRK